MTGRRLVQTISLFLIRSSRGRGDYLRRKKIFGYIGEDVRIQGRSVPLYPELIKLHNNVFLARNVHFETHDMIHSVLNSDGGTKLPEYVGCVEIMDNVFVGSDTTILYGVRIGDHVIIGSGSLVNRDLESGYVYAGVPARKAGTFDDFAARRADTGSYSYVKKNQHITEDEIEKAWELFEKKHGQKARL